MSGSSEALGQKIDGKTSLWLFTCLVSGLFLAPMIVGGANQDWFNRLTVVLCVALAAAILGAVVKQLSFALCCSVLLTWPAFGYALLAFGLRRLASADAAAGVSPVSVLFFAGVLVALSPSVVYLMAQWGASRTPSGASSPLAPRA